MKRTELEICYKCCLGEITQRYFTYGKKDYLYHEYCGHAHGLGVALGYKSDKVDDDIAEHIKSMTALCETS